MEKEEVRFTRNFVSNSWLTDLHFCSEFKFQSRFIWNGKYVSKCDGYIIKGIKTRVWDYETLHKCFNAH